MALKTSEHRVREVSRQASYRLGGVHSFGLFSWACGFVLQGFVATVGVSVRHVLADCFVVLLHDFCFCGDE